MKLLILKNLIFMVFYAVAADEPTIQMGCGPLLAGDSDEWQEEVQLAPGSYDMGYLKPKRWAALYEQIATVVGLKPEKVAEIGPGPGIFTHTVRQQGIDVVTVDIDESTEPDVIGSVRELPFEDDSHDIAVAFQVLEHLPYEFFVSSVQEMSRIARTHVVISVPDVTPFTRTLRQEGFTRPERVFTEDVNFEPTEEHVWDGEHYWEVGKKGFPQRKILKDLEGAGLNVIQDFRVFDHPYHHFYVIAL